ncbi:maleylpyruvate isomerase family mycothiol-dependent enzyme [Catenulispora pinisilvae]|uniref:maleylpyruvate isomerase family mycothiol-dependent enzyme n=1 Tax=Catenulispora pinisilvae TaxID=2705253 RepID=UPI0018922D9A|nr:maleylpyruvate isomerase family mycothiol-dependent enzyme [Catenulispora pinisilvae]
MTESPAIPASFDAAADLEQITEATAHLLTTVAELTDEELRQPSLCDGWTRGHVLTHIARNADGLSNLLNSAATGEVTPMYESNDKRNADIEAGSSRPVAEHLADLRESAGRFAEAFAGAQAAGHWDTLVYRTVGAEPISAYEVPGKRLGELLIHHVDLDADFTPAHWSDAFTDDWFAKTLERFGSRADTPALRLDVEEEDTVYGVKADPEDKAVVVVRGPKRALLGWLLGRASGDGLVAVIPAGGRGPLPKLPSWG